MPQRERRPLRERQREQREEKMLFAAAQLFAERGFDETSMDDIAAAAELSVTTIYNYFRSKSELLLGLLEIDRRLSQAQIERVLRAPPPKAIDAIVAALTADLEDGFDISQKQVWREISAASLRGSEQQRRDFLAVQSTRSGFIRELLGGLQKRGQIAGSIDVDSAARVLVAISRNCFRLYLMRDDADVDDLKRMVSTDVRTLLKGLGVP